MASWGIHFRIADGLHGYLPDTDYDCFLVGNIAPDCGKPVDGGYEPPSEITHLSADSNKRDCDWESIFSRQVQSAADRGKRSFYLGYCVHLMTDCLFGQQICAPLEERYGPFPKNPAFAKQVKREWYNLDFLYFSEHECSAFTRFCTLPPFDKDYPAFYHHNEIAGQMRYIASFYQQNKPQKMEYIYTRPEEIEAFVLKAQSHILKQLRELGIPDKKGNTP